MFQHILVPLDGSRQAEKALPIAARIAQASHATVVLLRVVTPPITFAPYPEAVWALETPMESDLELARKYLQRLTSEQNFMNIQVEMQVIEGTAATTIISTVEKRQIDLIVLCSHGYTGMKRWILGSVAEKVARHAPVPVLLLHEDGPVLVETPLQAETAIHALIPLDGSQRAKEAIVPAVQLMASLVTPRPGLLRLTLVIILPAGKDISPADNQTIVPQAKHYLNNAIEYTRERLASSLSKNLRLSLTWEIIRYEDIAEGIIHVAQETEYMDVPSPQIIAMTTHGYSGLQRWAMGSITERVLHATRLPLLIIRPADMIGNEQGNA